MKFDRRNFIASSALASATLLTPRAFAMSGGLSEADYLKLDAMDIADLVRRQKISPTDALNAAIARADKVNPAINAITIRLESLARKTIADGLPEKGPLRGVPFLLKDLGTKLAGTITSEGSRFFRDAVADHDGTLVQRYRAAGLVIWGKTASPEFGATGTTESLLWGATHNPWNLKHSAGGSSGGAAAAVAAGIVPAAHASDGGGSIRIPASNCGLFGMKPSRGRTPLGPDALESWMGLTANHAISRTVRDSAILLDIASGPEAGNLFARFEMERHPRLGHALELHLLDGQARRRLHDGCYDAHGLRRYGHRACWSMPSLQIAPIFWMLSDPRAALGKPNRVVRRRRLSSSVRAYAA